MSPSFAVDFVTRLINAFSPVAKEQALRRPPRTRLRLELLEARDVPSTTWIGAVEGAWPDPNNWDNGVPSPTNGAVFDPARGNGNVYLYGSWEVESLTILTGYRGEIGIDGSGSYSLTLDNNSTLDGGWLGPCDLVVAGGSVCTWKSTVLNSPTFVPNSVKRTITIQPNAVFLVQGNPNVPGGRDIEVGDDFSVASGGQLFFGDTPVTIKLTNSAGITNAGTLQLETDAIETDSPAGVSAVITNTGSVYKYNSGTNTKVDLAFWNNDPTALLEVGGRCSLSIRGKTQFDTYTTASVYQTSGTITLDGADPLTGPTSSLTASKGLTMMGGKFTVPGDATGSTAASLWTDSDSIAFFGNGVIQLGLAGVNHQTTLNIFTNVGMAFTTVSFGISPSPGNNQNDLLNIIGSLGTDRTDRLVMDASNLVGVNVPSRPWDIVKVSGTFNGGFAFIPPDGTAYTMTKDEVNRKMVLMT
jgi:hypothetical protein